MVLWFDLASNLKRATNVSNRILGDRETNCCKCPLNKSKSPTCWGPWHSFCLWMARRCHLEGGRRHQLLCSSGIHLQMLERLNAWFYFKMLLFLHWEDWIQGSSIMNTEEVKTEELWGALDIKKGRKQERAGASVAHGPGLTCHLCSWWALWPRTFT